MGRREENRERTRQRLIDASFELFRDRGFDESRVQDIATAAGVSPATFFNYFPSKVAVLEARAAESAALYTALISHELDRSDLRVAARLETIVTVMAAQLESDLEAARLLSTHTHLLLGATDDEADRIRPAQHRLTDLFAQGQASGEIDPTADPVQLAELFSAVVSVSTANWLTGWWGADPEPLGPRLVAAVRLLVDGMGSPTPGRRRPARRPDRGATA